jgi:hypothetical protein
MGKTLVGFLVGAALTSSIFVLLDRSSKSPLPVEQVDPAASLASSALDPGRNTSQSSQTPAAGDAAQSGAVELGTSPVSGNETEEARLIRQIEEARQLLAGWSADLEALQVARRLAEQPVVYPLPLPRDFDWVLDEPTGQLLHGLIQRENRDEAWAPQIEAELQEFIYSQADVIGRFGAPTITCRSTRCEVTLINNVADEELEAIAQRLRGELSQHYVYDRFALAPGSFWVGEHYEDGVATVFWSLPRRPD